MDLPARPAKPIPIYGLKGDQGGVVVYYHHIDGMYSYCTVDDPDPNSDMHTHLGIGLPLRQYKDGYKVIDEPKETDSGRNQENSGDTAN